MPSASANISAKFIDQIEMSADERSEVEHPGRGDEADDRQHQRQAGCDQRSEREREDHERDRPGEELALHHRRAVGGVEVRPHAGRAGQVDGHRGGAELLQRALEAVGGQHHLLRVARCACGHDRRVPVAADRYAGCWRRDAGDRRIGLDERLDAPRHLGECGVGARCARGSGARSSGRSRRCRRSASGSGSGQRRIASRWPPSRRPRARSRRAARGIRARPRGRPRRWRRAGCASRRSGRDGRPGRAEVPRRS